MTRVDSTNLSTARVLLRAGDLNGAEAVCNQVIRTQGVSSDALDLLAAVYRIRGQLEKALQLARAAIAKSPSDPAYHNNLGGLLMAAGRQNEAISSFQAALSNDPTNHLIMVNLADAYRQAGQLDAAATTIGRAVELAPDDMHVLGESAALLATQNRHAEATAMYELVVAKPGAPLKFRINLAASLEHEGRLSEAEAHLRAALQVGSKSAVAHNNLGGVILRSGRVAEAMSHFERALALVPEFPECHRNVAIAYRAIRDDRRAIDHLNLALRMRPGFPEALISLGDIHADHGSVDEAKAIFAQVEPISGYSTAAVMKQLTLAPPIPSSQAQIQQYRRDLLVKLHETLDRDLAPLEQPDIEVGACPFFITYQGEPNRELKRRFAQLYRKVSPSLAWTAPRCKSEYVPNKRIKVGFISKYLYRHSIGKTTKGLIKRLSRTKFEAHALFVPPLMEDSYMRNIRDAADGATVLEPTLARAREQIAQLRLDVLFYQDIGMDPFTYFLSFSRLAPVQCTSFGHPDTTGIEAIDYYISSDLYEPIDACSHYSEQLYCLRGVGTPSYYYRPEPGAGRSRPDLGLPLDRRLYLCPQTLFKLHPDMDEIFSGILREDPKGTIVLLKGANPGYLSQLWSRFEQTIRDLDERILCLSPLDQEGFMDLLANGDVILDPVHFCGHNSTLEAFSVGTPVITLPTQLQRGRHSLGMYRRMGIEDCIVRSPIEYVGKAVLLANDVQARTRVAERIAESSHVLFEDDNVVAEFEHFFEWAVSRRASKTTER